MEIRQLKAFLAIAEAKTFTAGAKFVNVTQAAISMQIRQLEDEVGLPLFTRTPRRVILTEAGEHLIERARKILREHDAAIAEISELAGAEHGRLRIGSALPFGCTCNSKRNGNTRSSSRTSDALHCGLADVRLWQFDVFDHRWRTRNN